MFNNFGVHIAGIFKKAEDERYELRHPYVGTEHLLLAILSSDSDMANYLKDYGLTYDRFKKELNIVVGNATKSSEINLYTPLLKRIMPNLKDQEAKNYIAMNISANIFELGFAATPAGLKAMKRLKEISSEKDSHIASDEMVTFLVLNTTGLTLIPTTIISLRVLYGSINPTKIIIPCFLATLIATISGLILNKIMGRRYE